MPVGLMDTDTMVGTYILGLRVHNIITLSSQHKFMITVMVFDISFAVTHLTPVNPSSDGHYRITY